jgi:hypothetical protein
VEGKNEMRTARSRTESGRMVMVNEHQAEGGSEILEVECAV